ncbi:MAG: diguanylate cyclase [Burkholderiales bacterium]|nr:diguanylate cyclase [Burkholderiales bacterium]
MTFQISALKFQVSLRTRFALGVGIMLLPLALLGASALFLLRYTTAALDEVVEEAIEEMHPVIHLQTLTLMAAMPPNDYLIHGEPAEKEEFARLTRELDRAFEETLAGPFGLGEERDLVRAAREEWRLAKAIASSLLALPRPVGNPVVAREMERMDAHIDRAVDLLGQVHDIVHREAGEASARAHTARRWAYALISGIFIAGIAIVAATAFALARSVLLPLRALETGANRFGAGDLSHRVELNRPDELGQLAQTFNAMAEALKKSRAALAALATRDGLTGLYNHRAFYTLLGDEFARAQRFKRPVSLLLLDIDHFKRVNDTHGHLAGDAVLKGLSELLGRQARAIDSVCRYGGEEITVILPETDLDAAAHIAERLRAAVEAQTFDVNVTPLRITVSIGVASWPAQADTASALVAAADAAMYAAKQSGRNRIIRYEPALGQPATQG